MKKLILFGIMLLCVSMFVAAEVPTFENHQFYGNIYYDNLATGPKEVIAKVGLDIYTSKITSIDCPKNQKYCTAKYGYESDNTLRVQANKGDKISFFLDKKDVKEVIYIPDESQKLDFNIATVPIKKDNCDTDYVYGNWSSCVNGTQTRLGIDKNKCDPAQLNNTEKRICGDALNKTSTPSNKTLTKTCTQLYSCTTYSGCENNQKTRVCTRSDTCDTQLKSGLVGSIISQQKPEETSYCFSSSDVAEDVGSTFTFDDFEDAESCSDGIKNQDETGVDCGGDNCDACQEGSNALIFIIGGVLILLILLGGGAWYFLERKKQLDPSVKSTLANTFRSGRGKGLSTNQIAQKLHDRGWDPGIVSRYLKG
jgi:hypothetical protein